MDVAGLGNLSGVGSLAELANLLGREDISSFDSESSFADVLTDTLKQYQKEEAGIP